MKDLPLTNFFEDFYIWFDLENKKEYYSVSLYLYTTHYKDDYDGGKRILIQDDKISQHIHSKKVPALRHPTSIAFPCEENLGYMLLRFLNTDFTNFDSAYDNFFFAYQFELLKEYQSYNAFPVRVESEQILVDHFKSTYEECKYDLMRAQRNFRACVDFLYNLNGSDFLSESSPAAKFAAVLVKREFDIFYYAKDIDVILDNFNDECMPQKSHSMENLIKEFEENPQFVKRVDIYSSPYLFSILFIILQKIAYDENIRIKKCQNCGKYFIPVYKQNEIYCDFENVDGTPSCRERGASETYKKNLETVPALSEYRRTYQQKFMAADRNKDNTKLREDFDIWKKKAQEQIKLFKRSQITEEELYKWMIENK